VHRRASQNSKAQALRQPFTALQVAPANEVVKHVLPVLNAGLHAALQVRSLAWDMGSHPHVRLCFRQNKCSECPFVRPVTDCCSLAGQSYAIPFQNSRFNISSGTASQFFLLCPPCLSHAHRTSKLWREQLLHGVQHTAALHTIYAWT
jgi:hypothetical protein